MSTTEPDLDTAQDIARKIVHRAAERSGGRPRAFDHIERRYGIRASQLRELISRPNKTLLAKLWSRLLSAYRMECERQIAELEAEIAKVSAMRSVDPENIRRAETLVMEARRSLGLERTE